MTRHLITSAIRTARLDAEDGATAVEYGLMVALIAVVIVAGVVVLTKLTRRRTELLEQRRRAEAEDPT
mgnify:CR=1 FL=1